jgi:hypothetical protein
MASASCCTLRSSPSIATTWKVGALPGRKRIPLFDFSGFVYPSSPSLDSRPYFLSVIFFCVFNRVASGYHDFSPSNIKPSIWLVIPATFASCYRCTRLFQFPSRD